jgi:hypothetical protein
MVKKRRGNLNNDPIHKSRGISLILKPMILEFLMAFPPKLLVIKGYSFLNFF